MLGLYTASVLWQGRKQSPISGHLIWISETLHSLSIPSFHDFILGRAKSRKKLAVNTEMCNFFRMDIATQI